MNLDKQTVIVTGGAGALGKAVVQCAAQQGAGVHIFDQVQPAAGSSATFHKVDLLDPGSVDTALSRVGEVDVLINLAGGFSMGPQVHEQDQQEWQKMFDINVESLRTVLRFVVPRMLAKGRGKIVNVGALGALQGSASMSAYAASKSVVMRLTESLSEEVKAQGINVNAVLPSVIDTPANRKAMPDADFKSWVPTEDLAAVICFLGSDAARAIHGALLPVKGLV